MVSDVMSLQMYSFFYSIRIGNRHFPAKQQANMKAAIVRYSTVTAFIIFTDEWHRFTACRGCRSQPTSPAGRGF